MNDATSNKYLKIAAGFIVFLIFGILHTWVIFPPLLRAILKSVNSTNKLNDYRTISHAYILLFQQVVLKNGTRMRNWYTTVPFPLIFKIYLWNVLNPEEVMKGGKPRLQELGPYTFE